jgi:hypothetical protein
MRIKKEGKVIFENGKIIEIRDFEVDFDTNGKRGAELLEKYVKEHYIKIEKETSILNKKLIDIIWEQLGQYTVVAHKTERDSQHIYSITGMIDKQEMEQAIQNYLLKK